MNLSHDLVYALTLGLTAGGLALLATLVTAGALTLFLLMREHR